MIEVANWSGPALTVRVPPADNLMIHKAISFIKSGDVVVIDGGGETSWALIGYLMAIAMHKMGAEGIIVHGCIRDSEEIRRAGIPVFCAGFSPNGPFKNGPGEINYPISCGGQIVNPGDLIIADADGVVVLHKELAPLVLNKVKQTIAQERQRIDEIESGQVIKPGIDDILQKKGFLFNLNK